MANVTEEDDYIFIATFLLFLLVNFEYQLGILYLGMVFASWMMFYSAKDRKVFAIIPFERTTANRLNALLWGVGAYLVFRVALLGLTRFFPGETIQSILTGFATTPVLSQSRIIKLLVLGILIPVVETPFFFRGLVQWVAHWSRTALDNLGNPKTVILFLVISGIFTLFHISAKGVTSTASLMASFIFAFMSLYMVIKLKEVKQAVIFHIVTNLHAALILLGYLR